MIPDQAFKFSGAGVHVWSLRVEPSRAVVAKYELLLAPDEKDRAARFRSGHLRDSFVTGRGVLRYLLGRYSDLHPASLQFSYGPRGKPAVASTKSIDFNMTHSGNRAAFAFTVDCQIGVDLERIRPVTDMQDIANRFFCPEEAAELMSLPPGDRERAFFCCWTRKEAYIKAIGDGLSSPLDKFRVTLLPSEPARLVHISQNEQTAQTWTLQDLRLASNYAAALAYHDQLRPLTVVQIADPGELVEPV